MQKTKTAKSKGNKGKNVAHHFKVHLAKKVEPKASRANEPKRHLAWPEYALLAIVCICTFSIVASFYVKDAFSIERVAENTITDLAKKYYIEYYYPHVLGKNLNDPAPILEKYAESGLPSISLRQLLYHDEASRAKYSKYFSRSTFYCHDERTYVNFYPVAPYGPRDYTLTYNFSCEKDY